MILQELLLLVRQKNSENEVFGHVISFNYLTKHQTHLHSK